MSGDPTCRVTSPLGEDFMLRDSSVKRDAGGHDFKENLQTGQSGGTDSGHGMMVEEQTQINVCNSVSSM